MPGRRVDAMRSNARPILFPAALRRVHRENLPRTVSLFSRLAPFALAYGRKTVRA